MITTNGYKSIQTILIYGVLVISGNAYGTDLDLADQPLFVTSRVEPNILFVLDSSRSMDWGLVTSEEHPTSAARGAIMRIETDSNAWDYFYANYAADNEQNVQDGVLPTQEAANATPSAAYMKGVWRARNTNYNKLYYDPDQTYQPWAGVDSAGNAYANASATAARQDPYNPTPTINLTANTSFTTERPCMSSEGCTTASLPVSYMPARYWVWEDTNTTTPANAGNGLVDADDTHTLVEIASGNQCTGSQTPLINGCYLRTYTDELQNFANWWTYHRRREYAMKHAVSKVIKPANGVRMGISTIHAASLEREIASMNFSVGTGNKKSLLDTLFSIDCDYGGTPLRSALDEAGKYFQCSGTTLFGGTHCPVQTSAVAPATQAAGVCQQNFSILLTDGYYSSSFSGINDADSDGSSYTDGGTTYRFDGNPYADNYSSNTTLADIAMHYYERDLHAGLDNKVPMSCGVDENPGQHMVTYTVGFGVAGAIDPTSVPTHPKRGYAASCTAESGNSFNWPDPNATNAGKIDDLVHAAYNGRGEYYSATQSDELTNALNAAVSNITARTTGSASVVDFNTGSVRAGSQVYQARFDSGKWSGQLLALALHDGSGNNGCSSSDRIGKVCPNPVWDASCTLTGGTCDSTGATIANPNLGTSRKILTYNPTSANGVSLTWANLDTAQQDALKGADNAATGMARLGYLRGDRGCEQGSTDSCSYSDGTNTFNTRSFRARDSLLGDIVYGSPMHVGVPTRRYPASWTDNLGASTPENGAGTQTYSDFKTLYGSRMTMVYAAANDGLLHGFESGKYNASGTLISGNQGKELLAYMPSQALAKARQLSEPNYSHQYYVDGAPTENDVFFQGDKKWHTVLVGGLGVGGQGVYALNVTNPDLTGKPDPQFEETNASGLVLWEFTDANDADLGYTVGQPAIVRLHNGKWGVLVSNGYNSSEADGAQSPDDDTDGVPDSPAVLFVLDVETGAVMAKLDTGVGAANDPLTQDRPNGLAAVFPVDKDGDFITDYAYAGDLYGNVWRFDLTDANASNWSVADFDGDPTVTGTPTPLFTAVDASGNPQSITTQVQANKHPNGLSHGVMVFFGTGKYLENGDSAPNTSTTQTFYAIWDKSFFGVGASINVLGALSSEKKHGFVRNELQQQQINAVENASGNAFRRVTDNSVTWSSGGSGSHGWYLDIKMAGGSNEGEMVVTDPVVRGAAVIFTTLIPSQNPCEADGTGFLMVLDQATGGRLKQTAFDVNNDNVFDTSDYLGFGDSGNEAASGVDVTGGTPGFILAKGKDLAVIPQFDGTVSEEELDLGVPGRGRKTWRQIR